MNDLLERVTEAGFRFDVSGDVPRLIPRSAGTVMPKALLEEVRVNRGEILAHLASGREPTTDPEGDSAPFPGLHCATCSAMLYTLDPVEVRRMCPLTHCPHQPRRRW